jgi:stalled ribosome rescue protein Dom34
MQKIKKDLQHGEITIKITEQDDLWHLSHVIVIRYNKRKTERKIRIGNEENAKVVRQKHLVLKQKK